MSVITIVGAGMMGSAMSFPAMENGNEVRLVGTHLDRHIIDRAMEDGFHCTMKRQLPAGIRYFQIENLSEALCGADLLIGGVSSFGLDWFIENILSVIPDELPVLMVTKGLMDTDEGGLIAYPDLCKRRYPERNLCINAVGGPCTSYELADLDPTTVCFCGDDLSALRKLKAMLKTSYYHISLSTDVAGVECAVALKNAYALGVSMSIGLSERVEGVGGREHYNSQAALFGQSVREMRKLLRHIGGQDDNIVLGAGDLYVTVFGGRTRKIGILLGRGLSFQEAMDELSGVTLESIVIATRSARAVRVLTEKGALRAADFPLLLHIDQIINQGALVRIPWDAFETEWEG